VKDTKNLLEFWETQMKHSHRSSNYFFRKSPSHYHMMLLVMSAHKLNQELSVEELKTKLFKTSRPKSAIIITEAVEKGFFHLEKTAVDQRKKFIKPTVSFEKEFDNYINTLKNLVL
jgi:DNA-binding MarR family transcriptional regulator|tara:strand:+ start:84 stop:431 length:348 start_codon:yes stop_codon:yes gene_type:complete